MVKNVGSRKMVGLVVKSSVRAGVDGGTDKPMTEEGRGHIGTGAPGVGPMPPVAGPGIKDHPV